MWLLFSDDDNCVSVSINLGPRARDLLTTREQVSSLSLTSLLLLFVVDNNRMFSTFFFIFLLLFSSWSLLGGDDDLLLLRWSLTKFLTSVWKAVVLSLRLYFLRTQPKGEDRAISTWDDAMIILNC